MNPPQPVFSPQNTTTSAQPPSAFDIWCRKNEIDDQTKSDLLQIVPKCHVVMLADDSSSMSNAIREESGGNGSLTTRWLELKKLLAQLLELISAINSDGLDLWFLNRKVGDNQNQDFVRVHAPREAGKYFAADPSGATPACSKVRQIFRQYSSCPEGKEFVLVIFITDG